MVRVEYTKCREMETIGNDADALRLLDGVFDAIDGIRDRKKRPDRDSVSEYICSRYGLDKSRADHVLDEMLLSGAIYIKKFKGKDSFFIRNEVKTGIKSQIARVCEHKEYPRVHSTISSGNPTQLLHDLNIPSPSQKTQDNYVLFNQLKTKTVLVYSTTLM